VFWFNRSSVKIYLCGIFHMHVHHMIMVCDFAGAHSAACDMVLLHYVISVVGGDALKPKQQSQNLQQQ
jgi:hypothetical protein